MTSTGTPVPDLHFRFAQATGTLRPLRRRLFGAREFPLRTRAYLLRSWSCRDLHILLPPFFFVQPAIFVCGNSPIWLCGDSSSIVVLHSPILRETQALSPTLALTSARAGFLCRVFLHGPRKLLGLLWDHWRPHPASAWLSQLSSDVTHVGEFIPSATDALGSGEPVPSLLESYDQDPHWWPRQVRKAAKVFFADLDAWNPQRLQQSASIAAAATPEVSSFPCYLCQSSFPLRKHLAAHLARTHQVFSPARHYALSERCSACLKVYPNIKQAQQHLKSSADCLLRCLYLHPPLTVDQFRALELAERNYSRASGKSFADFALPPGLLKPTECRLPLTAVLRSSQRTSHSDPCPRASSLVLSMLAGSETTSRVGARKEPGARHIGFGRDALRFTL